MTLDELFIKYGTDKSSQHHNYSKQYETIFNSLGDEEIDIFIMGIGGYHFTDRGGGDLLAFKEYLPLANIHAIDIYDKSFLKQDRISTYIGSQTDAIFLNNLIDAIGIPDVVIDDGSHNNRHVIKSFMTIFPRLGSGAIYIVEDCETSYYGSEEYQGIEDISGYTGETSINYFMRMVHTLNYKFHTELIKQDNPYEIESIQFVKNMIIIKKK